MLLAVNDQLPSERFAQCQKSDDEHINGMSTFSSSKAKLKQTLMIFTASTCHTKRFTHPQSHNLCEFTPSILVWSYNMRQACCEHRVFTGLFSVKRLCLETSGFQNVLSPFSGEILVFTGTLSSEDTLWKHRQMCGFSLKALPEEVMETRKTTKHKLWTLHVWVWADQNADSASLSRINPMCEASARVAERVL